MLRVRFYDKKEAEWEIYKISNPKHMLGNSKHYIYLKNIGVAQPQQGSIMNVALNRTVPKYWMPYALCE